MLELASLAIDMLARPAQRVRFSPGQYVGGNWVEGQPVTTDIMAAVQPIDAETLKQLTEGERTEASKAIWTRASLRTADEAAQTAADHVKIDAHDWKVLRVFDRIEGGYIKAIVGRL